MGNKKCLKEEKKNLLEVEEIIISDIEGLEEIICPGDGSAGCC